MTEEHKALLATLINREVAFLLNQINMIDDLDEDFLETMRSRLQSVRDLQKVLKDNGLL